jgi:beta-galactosidase
LLDVIGTNYRDAELLRAWADKPGRKIIGTEQGLDRSTWLELRDHPQHSGQFLWAGIDYLGEAVWPAVNSTQGVIDRTGAFKPDSYERQAWWSTQPMVKIERSLGADAPPSEGRGGRGGRGAAAGPVPQWTSRDPEHPIESTNITVYSNCDDVELFLNDKSLGSKPKAADDSPRTWNGVAFEVGTIKAVAKNGDKIVATDEMRTAGKPAKIALSVERDKLAPTFDDVSFITVTVVDDKGIACPYADDLISFKVDGPGRVAATDNGDSTAHESYQAPQRKLFNGRCVVVIKATGSSGKIAIDASAPGLVDGLASIEAVAAAR